MKKKLHFLTIFFLVIGSSCVNSSQQRPEQKAEFYQEGKRVLEFTVNDFNW